MQYWLHPLKQHPDSIGSHALHGIQLNHLNLHFCYAGVKDTTGTSPIKQTHPPPSPCVRVGLCRHSGHYSSSSPSFSTSSPSPLCPTPLSACGHLPSLHMDISHTYGPPPSYAYTGGISRHRHTLHPSLSPHSIIQPSEPWNMQELASYLICVVHLASHSIHCAPQAIYAHAVRFA